MNDDTDVRHATTLTRRDSLLGLGGIAAAALGAGGVLAALDGDDAEAASSGPAAVASGLVTCVLTPEMTEGPYYLDGDKVRRDIREGRPGTRLDLATTVVDVSTCKPIKGAAVDIWHCDAGGTYSGFAQEGTDGDTFMRGIQRTTKTGLATFVTVYPGWYSGRTVHIHVQVSLGGNVLHTGQLFFPEAAHRRRVPPGAVQPAPEPGHPERNRLDLPERRLEVDAEAREDQDGLRSAHHDGRSAARRPDGALAAARRSPPRRGRRRSRATSSA